MGRMKTDDSIVGNMDRIAALTLQWCRRNEINASDYDDYVGQAMLLLCQAKQKYVGNGKASLATFAWTVVRRGLINYRIEQGR
jgi:DNA-directed RNA polymerase specialized sigma24 family protein